MTKLETFNQWISDRIGHDDWDLQVGDRYLDLVFATPAQSGTFTELRFNEIYELFEWLSND